MRASLFAPSASQCSAVFTSNPLLALAECALVGADTTKSETKSIGVEVPLDSRTSSRKRRRTETLDGLDDMMLSATWSGHKKQLRFRHVREASIIPRPSFENGAPFPKQTLPSRVLCVKAVDSERKGVVPCGESKYSGKTTDRATDHRFRPERTQEHSDNGLSSVLALPWPRVHRVSSVRSIAKLQSFLLSRERRRVMVEEHRQMVLASLALRAPAVNHLAVSNKSVVPSPAIVLTRLPLVAVAGTTSSPAPPHLAQVVAPAPASSSPTAAVRTAGPHLSSGTSLDVLLSCNYEPPHGVARDYERQLLVNLLERTNRTKQGECLYVYGTNGVGKSFTIRQVLGACRATLGTLNVHWVSAPSQRLLPTLLESIQHCSTGAAAEQTCRRPKNLEQSWQLIRSSLKRSAATATSVVVIDEIDTLKGKSASTDYLTDLVSLAEAKDSNLVVIGISNYVPKVCTPQHAKHQHRIPDGFQRFMLRNPPLLFHPYTAKELAEIVRQRLNMACVGSTVVGKQEAFTDDAITWCTKKVTFLFMQKSLKIVFALRHIVHMCANRLPLVPPMREDVSRSVANTSNMRGLSRDLCLLWGDRVVMVRRVPTSNSLALDTARANKDFDKETVVTLPLMMKAHARHISPHLVNIETLTPQCILALCIMVIAKPSSSIFQMWELSKALASSGFPALKLKTFHEDIDTLCQQGLCNMHIAKGSRATPGTMSSRLNKCGQFSHAAAKASLHSLTATPKVTLEELQDCSHANTFVTRLLASMKTRLHL